MAPTRARFKNLVTVLVLILVFVEVRRTVRVLLHEVIRSVRVEVVITAYGDGVVTVEVAVTVEKLVETETLVETLVTMLVDIDVVVK